MRLLDNRSATPRHLRAQSIVATGTRQRVGRLDPASSLRHCHAYQTIRTVHDVDVRTPDGRRLIAEIKTTDPYLPSDFGAQQKQRFLEDFAKLKNTVAELKYLFVTEGRTYEILARKYATQIPDVQIVLLSGSVDGSV
jgi:hypothetical protein